MYFILFIPNSFPNFIDKIKRRVVQGKDGNDITKDANFAQL